MPARPDTALIALGWAARVLRAFRLLARAARIVLVGTAPLCDRYCRALAAAGLSAPSVAEHATERGLWRIAVQAGLVTGGGAATRRPDPEVP